MFSSSLDRNKINSTFSRSNMINEGRSGNLWPEQIIQYTPETGRMWSEIKLNMKKVFANKKLKTKPSGLNVVRGVNAFRNNYPPRTQEPVINAAQSHNWGQRHTPAERTLKTDQAKNDSLNRYLILLETTWTTYGST